MAGRVAADVDGYGWLGSSVVAEAGCVLVAVGADRAGVADAVGLDLDSAITQGWLGSGEQVTFLTRAVVVAPRSAVGGEAWVVCEDNGFEGSRALVLEDASRGGKAASIFWNVNGLVVFSCARRGKVLFSAEFAFDEDRDGLPASLGAYVDLAQSDADDVDLVAIGAATVEKFTGVRFGPEVVDGAQVAFPVAPRAEELAELDEHSSGLRWQAPELLGAVCAADPVTWRPLARWLTGIALRQAAVIDVPTVVEATARLSDTEPLAPSAELTALMDAWERTANRVWSEYEATSQPTTMTRQRPDGTWETWIQDDGATRAAQLRWNEELLATARLRLAARALQYAGHVDSRSAALGVLEVVVGLAEPAGLVDAVAIAVTRALSAAPEHWPAWPDDLPPPSSAAELEARLTQARHGEVAARQAVVDAAEAGQWGGSVPSGRLRQSGWAVQAVAQLERPLVDDLADLPDERLDEVTRWVIRRVLREARLLDVAWVAAAVAAAEEGRPLPAPFEASDPMARFRWLEEDPGVPHTTYVGEHGPTSVQYMALPILDPETGHDALGDVARAVWNGIATFGPRRQVLIDELRTAFSL